MFKRQMIQDERITNLQNKIYREIYIIVLMICSGSMVLKVISGKGGFENLGTEMIIFFVGALYYLVRSANLGIFSEEIMYAKGKEVKNPDSRIAIKGIGIGAVIGIVLGLVFGINSALNYAEGMGQSIYYFFLTFATTVMMYTPFLFIVLFVPYILAKKKSERVNKKMLEELEEDEQ
ncbi:DUF6773 family protein [Lysinibacillus endophyticus]|uniref:DUF6773 family protein n=1 Tax=Ureibacillus endophyticus TaxID=1978490 RepID=UPI00209F694C|nr:DUF6773 family protein [Lysinibacillus endophyticus]MCP1144434.1 hypothetical protein [Lysinibacillus endophyticus]